MIKLIIFDLDGVLVSSKELHYNALNKALSEVAPGSEISLNEHLGKYDGLSTKAKLALLTKDKGLPENLHSKIWDLKQKFTVEFLSDIQPDIKIIDVLNYLSRKYTLCCCTNSIRETTILQLQKKGFLKFFNKIFTNEDVLKPKPDSEIYLKCILSMGVNPDETLILEDSYLGRRAALRSGANLLPINSPDDVNLVKINNAIMKINKSNYTLNKWKSDNLNVLIPMAGAGSRFEKAGYTFPKPLIDVNGKPMIQVVVENLNIEAQYIFIVQQSHLEKYNLYQTLNLISPNCKIIPVNGVTEGAACTTLLAKELINNDTPLLMANSDQFVEWRSDEFMYNMTASSIDGGILTFKSTHPKWSYAKTDLNGFVTEVAEKNPISDIATVGIYYWKHGKDYVNFAEQMIKKNVRVNNEFYVCPVFNEAILNNKKIKTYDIEKMWGIGTPEDLDFFVKNYNR